MSKNHLGDTRLSSLPLNPSLLRVTEELGFDYCTPIQAETLPLMLDGKDVLGQAQTGTGKTATFLLAVMNRILTHHVKPTSPRC